MHNKCSKLKVISPNNPPIRLDTMPQYVTGFQNSLKGFGQYLLLIAYYSRSTKIRKSFSESLEYFRNFTNSIISFLSGMLK